MRDMSQPGWRYPNAQDNSVFPRFLFPLPGAMLSKTQTAVSCVPIVLVSDQHQRYPNPPPGFSRRSVLDLPITLHQQSQQIHHQLSLPPKRENVSLRVRKHVAAAVGRSIELPRRSQIGNAVSALLPVAKKVENIYPPQKEEQESEANQRQILIGCGDGRCSWFSSIFAPR